MSDKITLTVIKNEADFRAKLAKMVKTQKTLMNSMFSLSVYAIEHFAQHGQLGPCQDLHDAMRKNFQRRSAFVKWLAHYAPVTMEQGKFKKDKSDGARPFDVDGARANPFWEFAPETEIKDYNLEILNAALLKTLTSFEGKKYNPNTDQTVVVTMEKYRNLFTANGTAADAA